MANSSNPRHFDHIKVVLDAALAQGGGRYACKDAKTAIRWRMQAYHLRKLLQRFAQQAVLELGVVAPTDYDGMYLTLEGATVVIQFREAVIPQGALTDLEGKPIFVKEIKPAKADDLVGSVEEIKRKLIG